MKKFLTVFLALSVVFTYTVGTAFALPSDGTDQAGLKAAKAEAVAELEAYPDMSEYNANGQAQIKGIIAEYTIKINDAPDLNGTKGVYTMLTEAKTEIGKVATLTVLRDAQKAALKQFDDYVYLFEELIGTDLDAEVKDAKVGYNSYKAFKTAAKFEIAATTDLDSVAKALDTYLVAADKVFAQYKEVSVSQTVIDNLVKAIRTKAESNNVTSGKNGRYSVKVAADYEAAIAEGVAAAKAVRTADDYWKVYDKYLGCDETLATYRDNDVIIHIAQLSVFDKLVNMDLDKEGQVKAVKELLAKLGEYNWKDYTENEWVDIETFYAQAKYFIENGVFEATADMTGTACTALNDLVGSVDKTTVPSARAIEVTTAFNTINGLTALKAVKTDLVSRLENYAVDGDYNPANATLIRAYRKTGITNINVATSKRAAQSAYDEAVAKIDAVKTETEINNKDLADKVNDAVDTYVDNNLDETVLSPDQVALAKRFVTNLKERLEYLIMEKEYDANPKNVQNEMLVPGGFTLAQVVTGAVKEFSVANVQNAGYTMPSLAEYNERNAGIVDGIVNEYNKKLNTLTTWGDFFKTYDAYMAEIDPIQTLVQENYVKAINNAKAAFNKLGAPALTKEFKQAMKDAEDAYDAYLDAKDAEKNGFDSLPDDEQAEVTATLDTTAYDDAKLEYERLLYLDGKTETANTIKEVNVFTIIADYFLTDMLGYFDANTQDEIAKIVTDTYATINAATTDAAKVVAAIAGIEKLDALTVYDATVADVAELIATIKAEAAKYFDKYEGATFTSDAATKLDLVKDIIEFNAQFYDAVKLAKEELIKDIKGTHMKIGSSAAKGYIRISWKQSNSTVALDGVKVYRSTKKTSGFKLISTFKKQTAKKYTANLKKGTKYYYKVKGYKVIDGVTYYTHESITVGRTFR